MRYVFQRGDRFDEIRVRLELAALVMSPADCMAYSQLHYGDSTAAACMAAGREYIGILAYDVRRRQREQDAAKAGPAASAADKDRLIACADMFDVAPQAGAGAAGGGGGGGGGRPAKKAKQSEPPEDADKERKELAELLAACKEEALEEVCNDS